METKICTKCLAEKELSEFYKTKNNLGGLCSYCKKCCKKTTKEYYDKKREYYREYYKKHKQKYHSRYKYTGYRREYYLAHREQIRKASKKYYQTHREQIIKASLIYYKKNETRIKRIVVAREKEKMKKNIPYRLKRIIFRAICNKAKAKSLKINGKKIEELLPYTMDDLKKHLESKFELWMNWDNYGKGAGKWVIDHKYPEKKIFYKNFYDKEFIRCWALNNLQPLECIENLKKRDKIL